MEPAKCLVLLIMTEKDSYLTSLRKLLLGKGLIVCEAASVNSAFQKISESSPDLIICQNNLNGLTGFRIFKTLQSTLIKKSISFLIFLEIFSKEDILIGLEMGIDNFIIHPFDELSVLNKIEKQILKSRNKKIFDSEQYRYLFELTPIAKFITENDRILMVNKAFSKISGLDRDLTSLPSMDDLLVMEENETNRYDFHKCINGLKKCCFLKSLPLRSNPLLKFDIHLVNNDYFGENIFIAEVVPGQYSIQDQITENAQSNKTRFMANEVLTRREKEILDYSAKGLPIKQIAREMKISARTVEKHRANIMTKTNTTNIIEAIYILQKSFPKMGKPLK
jgi:two-component system alkaline phosphatase synthesis response regulator PhoP